jgi:pyrimidine operon attenuation protein/uracil phosphoribosyltransferase
LGDVLKVISPLRLIHVNLEMNKSNPRDTVKSSSPIENFKDHSIVIIDDVLNTGSTLIYAVSYFLQIPVKQINTAVMVNRNHKKYPIKADFKGISLSTSLNDHVKVVLEGEESGIYLS